VVSGMSAGRRDAGPRRANWDSIVGPLTAIRRSRLSFSAARAARTKGRQKDGPVRASYARVRSSWSSSLGLLLSSLVSRRSSACCRCHSHWCSSTRRQRASIARTSARGCCYVIVLGHTTLPSAHDHVCVRDVAACVSSRSGVGSRVARRSIEVGPLPAIARSTSCPGRARRRAATRARSTGDSRNPVRRSPAERYQEQTQRRDFGIADPHHGLGRGPRVARLVAGTPPLGGLVHVGVRI
jgi:hypothetical protein